MLKLPLCPYCKAIYRYGDVKKNTHKKSIKCHNCGKSFEVSYLKGRIIFICIVAALLIVINILLLNFVSGITILACLLITVAVVGIAVLLFPYTVRYKKTEAEKDKKRA